MKQITFLFIFCSLNIFGQNLDTIKKIDVFYGRGDQCFPRSGIYSRSEKFTITPSENKDFYLTSYGKYWSIFKKKGNKFSTDSTITFLNKKIDTNLVVELLENLNSDKQNFSYSFLNNKIKNPYKSQIKKIARKKELFYMINCDGLFDCDYRNKVLDSIQNFEHFDRFVSSNLSLEQLVVIGYFNLARITVISNKNVITYDFSFLDSRIGQPFFKNYNKNYLSKNSFVNLEVNQTLRKLVPKKSITSKAFNLQNTTDDYIAWYLQNQLK